MGLLNLAIESIFIQNILLALFLGMCSYLAQSKKMESAKGLGMAVIMVFPESDGNQENWTDGDVAGAQSGARDSP